MLGSRSGSLLIWSKAYSMASSRWIPFSLLISPQGTPAGPRACTGNSPPRVMSPSILMDWGWVPCWANEPGMIPTSRTHSSPDHILYPGGEPNQQHWWDERASKVMMTSRGTDSTRPLPLPLTPADSQRRGFKVWFHLIQNLYISHSVSLFTETKKITNCYC